jgi:hypothetical protein
MLMFMPLPLPTQWTLVACGLVAHADGTLDGEEIERLMELVDEEADGDEYARWLSIVSDPLQLAQLSETLASPPAESHRDLLEQAWMMSVIDGHRTEAELRVLEGLAERFGVEAVQLEFWRDAWAQSERELADALAVTLAIVLAPQRDDEATLRETIARVPAALEERDRLLEVAFTMRDTDEVVRRLSGLSKRRRSDVLRLVAGPARASEAAKTRFVALAVASGIAPAKAQSLLAG